MTKKRIQLKAKYDERSSGGIMERNVMKMTSQVTSQSQCNKMNALMLASVLLIGMGWIPP